MDLAKTDDFKAKIDAVAFQKLGSEFVEHLSDHLSDLAGFLGK